MKRAVAFILTCMIFAAGARAETIAVAAAISLKDARTKVAEEYKAETGDTVEFTLGSSGQLASQIHNGAPIDVFISAASKQVDDLVKSGAADPATRKVVAGNALVIVVPKDSQFVLGSIKDLADSRAAKVAIGEPKSVPAGQYAEQALKHAGMYDSMKDKLVLGTNVRQVLDYVERGEVSAGMVYMTDARVSGAKSRVACVIDAAAHDAIVYPAVIVSASKKKAHAARFLEFVLSDKGQTMLREYGFTAPPTTESTR